MKVEKSNWPNSFLLAICLKKDSIWNNLPTIQNKQRGIFRKRTFAGDPPRPLVLFLSRINEKH